MLKFKQLDEISKGLRDKYVAKATAAHGHYNMARRNTTGADQEYFARKEKNTQKGISRALDDKRLNKESTDMCNVCGQTPCNCTSIEEAKATMCGRCGTKHVHPSKGGKCPALGESLQQTLRKFVPGYAKRQIDNKMDAGKFGKTDADKDANFHRYKKIQDKLKEETIEEASLPKGSMVPGIPSKRDTAVKRAARRAAVVPAEKAKATYGVGYRQESVVNEAKEKTEYDYEGDMARGQLQSIINNAQRVHDMLKDNDNLPEWVQSKITLAEDYISTVSNYMQSEVDESVVDNMDKKAVNEIKMTDDEYKDKVGSYGKRATNLLKHSWDQHDVGREKAKAGDKEGAAKATATGSRAHKLFLKARDKHLQNPEHAEANRKKIMSGASDYYKSKKPGEYTGDSFDPTLTNSNPYLGEGLVDEAREASYDGEYQSAVLRFREKAKKQEQERGPVDIQKLAARLKAVKLKPEGTKK